MNDKDKFNFPPLWESVRTIMPAMTLREYYIGCALTGLCTGNNWEYRSREDTAMIAIVQADAVIAVLAKGE